MTATARETRLITCPKCDPKKQDPDKVTGDKDSLKYLIAMRNCKICGTLLVDLGRE